MKKEDLKEGKWYVKKNDISNAGAFKFKSYNNELYCYYSERISSEGIYANITGSILWGAVATEISTEEIQKYLPKGHPDLLVENDYITLNDSYIGKLVSFYWFDAYYDKVLVTKEGPTIYLLNNCSNNSDSHKDKSVYKYSLRYNSWGNVNTSCTKIKLLKEDLDIIIPEYVECIKGREDDAIFNRLGRIYKVEKYNSITGELQIGGEIINKIFFGEKSRVRDNTTDYKISTKKAYEQQNKPKENLNMFRFKVGDKVKFISNTSKNAKYFKCPLDNLEIKFIENTTYGYGIYDIISEVSWSVDDNELELIPENEVVHCKWAEIISTPKVIEKWCIKITEENKNILNQYLHNNKEKYPKYNNDWRVKYHESIYYFYSEATTYSSHSSFKKEEGFTEITDKELYLYTEIYHIATDPYKIHKGDLILNRASMSSEGVIKNVDNNSPEIAKTNDTKPTINLHEDLFDFYSSWGLIDLETQQFTYEYPKFKNRNPQQITEEIIEIKQLKPITINK